MPYQTRLDNLRAQMARRNVDILALIPGPNLFYLTGGVHYVLERPIVMFIPLVGTPISVIPKLEVPLFSRHHLKSELYAWSDAEGYEGAFAAALQALGAAGKTIGVEGLRMRFFESEIIRRLTPDARLVEGDVCFAELRIIKDDAEIAALREAVRISEAALERTIESIRVGMSEIEMADLLESHIKALGGDGTSFRTILHAGGNTALPHTGPLDYRARDGDPLLIDFGAKYRGYCADITRVVFLGDPSPDQIAFYDVVKAANAAGRAAAKPGVTAESVDRAARQVLVEAGYAHLIRHRTGHGIGIESHEPPYIVEGNQQTLQPGMTFTVEPGIYELNVLGVRIEDNILITADGAESLSTFEREIRVVG